MTAKLPTEHQEQVALIQWFDATYREHRGRLFSVPNGTNKSRAAAAHFKREGLRSGVPDLMLPVASMGYHGLFIEMKRQKGGVISEAQKKWNAYLNEQGYLAVFCCGFEDAKQVIERYLT